MRSSPLRTEPRDYVSNYGFGAYNTLAVLDLVHHAALPSINLAPLRGPHGLDWNETIIPVGHGSEGFDVSPDRREIWVANAQDGTVSIIDYAARRVVATLHPEVDGANRLKFTPDGKHVLISTLGGPDLVVLDAMTREVIKRIPTGHGVAGIVVPQDGSRAYVACTPDSYVAVIDLRTLTVVGHIDAGGEPDGMDWATLP